MCVVGLIWLFLSLVVGFVEVVMFFGCRKTIALDVSLQIVCYRAGIDFIG